MNSRERVLRALRFEASDRVPYDLMEGAIWPGLMDYFRSRHGLEDKSEVLDFLGADLRWVGTRYDGPEPVSPQADGSSGEDRSYSKAVDVGPLAGARTIADVEARGWPDPAWWQPADYEASRRQWPDHALVFSAGWMPLFWSACEAFGMADALARMLLTPRLFEAFVRKQHEFYVDILRRGLSAARGWCDVCWLGDDFASQRAMMMSPDLWRKFIAPCLAEQVRLARESDMYVLFHSCGAVRPVLPDLIDMGVNALLVFQTTASGMDVDSIAGEFGGHLAFYGGMDVQQLLSYGSMEEVQAQVRADVQAFAECGGYIVANSHHGVPTISGDNLVAMCEAARHCVFPFDA